MQRRRRAFALDLPSRWSRRVVLHGAGAALLAGVAARGARLTDAQGPPLPATPLGDQLGWVLTQINGGAAALTEADVALHFAPSLLAGFPAASVIASLEQVALLGPFAFRGFPDPPTATSAVATVAGPTGKIFRLTIAVEPVAPSRIVNLLVSPVTEVRYTVAPIGPTPRNLAFDGDLFFNNAGQVACSVRFPQEGNRRGAVLKDAAAFTTLLGPDDARLFAPTDIDESGRLVASWTTPDGIRRGCTWRADQFVDLAPLPGGNETRGYAAGPDGTTVGWSTTGTPGSFAAVRWDGDRPEPLGVPAGMAFSAAVATNGLGLIAGYAADADGANRALLWDERGWTDLGPLAESRDTGFPGTGPGIWSDMFPNEGPPIMVVTDFGQVAWTGVSDGDAWHPFLWTNGVASDLGALDGGQQTHEVLDGVVTALGGDGLVVGWAKDLATDQFRPFAWDGGPMTDLGLLPGGDAGSAVAIGGFGRIVGWSESAGGRRAAVWGEWGLSDLGVLPGHAASEAVAANDAGQILGWSYAADANRTPHPVLWVPIPE